VAQDKAAYNKAYYALTADKQRERARAYYWANREKRLAKQRAYVAARPEFVREVVARSFRLRKYGLTPEQYNTMLAAQDYKCATCGSKDGECSGHSKRLVVDHMHCSGKVRALLCSNCNLVLGLLKENADTADAVASLLRKHQAH
jgi:hypothetical protein